MIKSHLSENFARDEHSKLVGDDEVIEDIWANEKKNSKILAESTSSNKKKPQVVPDSSSSNSDDDDDDVGKDMIAEKFAKKKTKKLNKGSLLPSGAHLSWKDEIEKMLKWGWF